MSIREWILLAIIVVTNCLHFLYEMQLIEEAKDMNEDWADFCNKAVRDYIKSYNDLEKRYNKERAKNEEISRKEREKEIGSQK